MVELLQRFELLLGIIFINKKKLQSRFGEDQILKLWPYIADEIYSNQQPNVYKRIEFLLSNPVNILQQIQQEEKQQEEKQQQLQQQPETSQQLLEQQLQSPQQQSPQQLQQLQSLQQQPETLQQTSQQTKPVTRTYSSDNIAGIIRSLFLFVGVN